MFAVFSYENQKEGTATPFLLTQRIWHYRAWSMEQGAWSAEQRAKGHPHGDPCPI